MLAEVAVFDNYERLISFPGKIEVACPEQHTTTGVILVSGQSNAANHAEKIMKSRYPGHVYNYFAGKCYEAKSPMLGTTGSMGEFLTPMADYLIEFGVYKDIVLIPSAIDATKIALWAPGGHLNYMLRTVLDDAKARYALTEIIWHQGETDFLLKTPTEDYKKYFSSLLTTLKRDNSEIPVHYAISTRCGENWEPNNDVAKAQYTFANAQNKVYLGADTDSLIVANERIKKYCHFAEAGQLKTAHAFATSIYQQHIMEMKYD